MCGAIGDVEEVNKLCYCMSHKYFKDAKSYANKQDFEIKFDLSGSIHPKNKTS